MALTVELQTAGPPRHFEGQAIGQAGDQVPEFQIVKVTFDSSYPSGGELLTPGTMGFTTITGVVPEPCTNGGYMVRWDETAGALVAFYGDTNAVADGALIEVPNTTNLSAESIRCLVFGTR